ncbi:MAG: carbamoyltransferase C-terminal domain-containing protein, partial [Alphaproteobacteria bacterium]|nr:carbamoyltransferase C-terminal domain-containing protein [Alphaproteobacteria bacterium]
NIGIGPSVCLLDDGEPVFAIEEERLSREKGAMGFPTLSLQYLEQHWQPFLAACDAVALANEHIAIFDRKSFLARYDARYQDRGPIKQARDALWRARQYAKRALIAAAPTPRSETLAQVKAAAPSVTVAPDRVYRIGHHDCHAAAAYFGLARTKDKPFLILTLDGGGDFDCATVQIGDNGRLRRIATTASGNSIGNIYSNVTYLMGMTPHEHEYKLMGMAAYTVDEHKRDLSEVFRPFVDLDAENPLLFTHAVPERTTWSIRRLDRALRRRRFDNIAGALQLYTEDLVLRWVRAAIRETGVHDLLLSGGVFMNVSMNKSISLLPEVQSLNVFPSCGDETNSIGAAFAVHAELKGELSRFSRFTLGPDADDDMDELEREYGDRCRFERVGDVARRTAELLASGKIVARCDGAMEFGARALGNRSVLADPRTPNAVAKINATIKQRDFWMPFAPAILAEDLDKYVVVPDALPKDNPSPYMMFVMDSREEYRDDMAATLHPFDKSARVQVVDRELYPEFHSLLTAFKATTGRSCLLNTSFNIHGHPIVRTAREALDILVSSNLDCAAFAGHVVEKR